MLSILETPASAIAATLATLAAASPAIPACHQGRLPQRTIILGEENSLGTLVIQKTSSADQQVARLTSPDYADLVVIIPLEAKTVQIDLPAGRYMPEFLSGHDWNEDVQGFNHDQRIAYGAVFTVDERKTLEIKAH